MAKKPYAETRLAKFVETRLLDLRHRKTQADIAAEVGFRTPNLVTMIKSGATKLPIDRVIALSEALECDPAFLLRLALEQSAGNAVATAIFEVTGGPVTKNEMVWLGEIRAASGDTDPVVTSLDGDSIRRLFMDKDC